MIELRDVYKRFGTQVILDGVNLTVKDGETLALLGPSGTGKSVLLKHIVGLIRPDRGQVIVDGKEVRKLTDQAKYLDEDYCRERVERCLKMVNLSPDTADKYPAQLSGGMRKRVGISRAIAGTPKYLLYDEPTSGLDPVNSDIIDDLVKSLADELGVTSIMVTHDVKGSFRTADRIALLTHGKIVQIGTPKEFMASTVPEVREFLERDFGNVTFAA